MRTLRPKTGSHLRPGRGVPEIGGSKVVRSSDEDQVTVVATGITVHNAIEAARKA